MSGLPRRWGHARAVLRLARRDALRARGRTALVLVMVGLPVLAVSSVDVLARSDQMDPQDVVAVTLGDAVQALVRVDSTAPVVQLPNGDTAGPPPGTDGEPVAEEPLTVGAAASRVSAAIPGRDRLVPRREGGADLRVGDRAVDAGGVELDLADPALAGIAPLRRGRLPAAADEVAVSTGLARHAGLEPGDEVRVGTDGDLQRVHVVGVVLDPSTGYTVFAPPGALFGAADPSAAVVGDVWTTWYLVGPKPLSWPQVQALNALGATAISRAVLLNPPPPAEVTAYVGHDQSSPRSAQTVAVAGVVAGLALLEVALLAGPAFAVGARRQRRQLAMLAAAGAERRQVRDTVLAQGLVTGLLASLAGMALGVAVAAAFRLIVHHYALLGIYLPRLDVRPLDLLAVVAVGTLTALGAALLPALQASRQDIVAALAGRRGQVRVRRRVPLTGAAATAVGTALAVTGAVTTRSMLVLTGAVLAELGLVATTGALVAGLARLAPRLRAPGRIAVRDAARQRGRTAPAVAAIMTAVAGTVAVAGYVVADDTRAREAYQPSGPPGTVIARSWSDDGEPALARLRTLVAAELDLQDTAPLRTLEPVEDAEYLYVSPMTAPGQECPLALLDHEATSEQVAAAGTDPRCNFNRYSGQISEPIVDDGSALAVLTGTSDPADRAALADGVVLVASPRQVWPDGTVHLQVEQYGDAGTSEAPKTVVLPARVTNDDTVPVVIPPTVVDALHARATTTGLVATTAGQSDPAAEERVDAAIADAGLEADVYVERGYRSSPGLTLLALTVTAAVVALGASLTAVGLAAAESRADLATLAAVGAPPAVRRRVAAAQALTVAGTGAVLGTVAGVALGALVVLMQRHGMGGFDPSWRVVVPWRQVLAVGVGVPMLAAAAGFAFTRSRLPMVRRLGQ